MHKQQIIAVLCVALALAVGNRAEAQKTLAIKGGTIVTMAGDPIENGVILFRDGKIAAVGTDLSIPVEAQLIDATGKIVMPGFVEAHSSAAMSQPNENNPNVPYVSVLDSINPMDDYFREARRNGVTSVAVTPGNSTMIGGQAAVIKTGGTFVDYMVLKPDAGIKISLRPVSGSRMGHLAKLRKALDDAREKMKKSEEKSSDDKAEKKEDDKAEEKEGGDAKEKKEDAQKEEAKTPPTPEQLTEAELDKAMFALLRGELPAIIYCDQAMDVAQAARLISEYNLKARLVVGQDCYKAASQIADLDVPVILDPTLVFWEEDPRTKEQSRIVVTEAFRENNVPFVFQVERNSSPTLGSNYLWYQAATAVKYGMPADEALQALTTLPARFLGVDSLVGSIEPGKDGDVIILTGQPLDVNTWVETTIVNGEVVYERSKDRQLKQLLGEEEMDE